MEKKILKILDFKLNIPTTVHFIKIYYSLFQIEESVMILASVIKIINNNIIFFIIYNIIYYFNLFCYLLHFLKKII